MLECKEMKEIVVTVANKIGILSHISKLLSDAGMNIEAVLGYAAGNEAKIMLVVGDNRRAIEILKKSNYTSIKENSVVVLNLENKPGALKVVTDKLVAAGIDLKKIYGTACSSGCPAKIIFSTSDNAKALSVLK